MTSRERTLKAITFGHSDRLPLAKSEDADIAFVGARLACGLVPAEPGMDEWGCVYMHTCGNLSEFLPVLADAGVELIANKQLALWIASPALDAVRGRVAFATGLDIQHVMQMFPLSEIGAAVAALVQRLSLPAGGFIGTYYHQPDLAIEPKQKCADAGGVCGFPMAGLRQTDTTT